MAEDRVWEASRETDAGVSRRVFGVEVMPGCPGVLMTRIWNDPEVHCAVCGLTMPWNAPGYQQGRHDRVPRYSTDISEAWRVVEALRSLGLGVSVATSVAPLWEVEITTTEALYQQGIVGCYVEADTAPLAICRAALKALAARRVEGK